MDRYAARSRTKLTPARKGLLLAMHDAGPRRVHHVNDLGYRLESMKWLKRVGLVDTTTVDHAGLWRGRLSRAGRAIARVMRVLDRKAGEP